EVEYQELQKNLIELSNKNGINAIHVSYGFKEPNEYGLFSSSRVDAKDFHTFTVKKSKDGVKIENGSKLIEKMMCQKY
ncbi:hypothetical protein, partial [Erwinia amylovora]